MFRSIQWKLAIISFLLVWLAMSIVGVYITEAIKKSVPRITKKLFEAGEITEEDCYRIHGDTVEKVYGVKISL